jgi:hypothetical protein
MLKNNQIPVLTDLIEKGVDIKSEELRLNRSEDLILEADDREEPHIDANPFDFKVEPVNHALADDPVLEKTIRRILNEHMELALTEIKLAIKTTQKTR